MKDTLTNEAIYKRYLKGIKNDAINLKGIKGVDEWTKLRIKILKQLFEIRDEKSGNC